MNDFELTYPWFGALQGDELEQGHLFDACPVYQPTGGITNLTTADFRWVERDVIVLSQSCDLVKGREKVTEVLLATVWNRSELLKGHLATNRGLEDTRRGNLPGFHLLAECCLSEIEREVRVVDFRRLYNLPIEFLQKKSRR